jgi:two-component sensor histidine kinase
MTDTRTTTPASPTLAWPGGIKHFSLRRGLLLLLVLALLPITVLSILQGIVRVETRRSAGISQLSANATALAGGNQAILTGTGTLLRATAMNPLVREGGTACARVLVATAAASEGYANLALYDSDGRLMCAATPPVGDYVIPDRAWWNAIIASRNPLVSDAKWGPLSKKRVITVALPLKRETGAFGGALIGSLDVTWLDTQLRRRVSGETGVAVLSESGQVLMTSHKLPRFDLTTPEGTVGRARNADGNAWSYMLVPLVRAGPGQQGLFVAYAAPEPGRFGLVWWQTIIDFALPVLAILLASLAIWVGAERLVLRWLRGLQQLAMHFAGGDYRHRPLVFAEAPRELRSVAASLYRMSNAVSERDRALRDALEQQRLLAREVHHRVKNNFQVVMSLLSLQSSRLSDDNARRAIDQARRRISALALVHRQLYDTGELASISSRALLGALCEQLQPGPVIGSMVELHCDFDDVPLDIDNAVPLTLWMVEAVTNALHHAFPGPVNGKNGPSSGVVRAMFRFRDGTAELTISDNGIGIETSGDVDDRPDGQGMRLIRALASQLGGTAEVCADENSGTVATLRFVPRPTTGTMELPPVPGVHPAAIVERNETC